MSTLNVNNINEAGGVDAVITAGILDSGSLPAGSILQVVRATDTTNRSTTSTSYVDANLSVTITPTSASNSILFFANGFVEASGGSNSRVRLAVSDSSDVIVNGAESQMGTLGVSAKDSFSPFVVGYDSPASTSALTYKLRFRVVDSGTTLDLLNALVPGQLIAIEVAG